MINQIKNLRKTKISKLINKRLKQLEKNKEWFSELCFCILTANSRAKTAISIQNELGEKGFLEYSRERIRKAIIKNKHRFHNNKSKYIVEARKCRDIKSIITDFKNSEDAREWLVKNVKGIGYKEASHFLRNVGYFDLAILDRHILNLMTEQKIIKKPKSMNKKIYLEIEKKFVKIAKELKMSPAELDFYMWYMKTGEVLK